MVNKVKKSRYQRLRDRYIDRVRWWNGVREAWYGLIPAAWSKNNSFSNHGNITHNIIPYEYRVPKRLTYFDDNCFYSKRGTYKAINDIGISSNSYTYSLYMGEVQPIYIPGISTNIDTFYNINNSLMIKYNGVTAKALQINKIKNDDAQLYEHINTYINENYQTSAINWYNTRANRNTAHIWQRQRKQRYGLSYKLELYIDGNKIGEVEVPRENPIINESTNVMPVGLVDVLIHQLLEVYQPLPNTTYSQEDGYLVINCLTDQNFNRKIQVVVTYMLFGYPYDIYMYRESNWIWGKFIDDGHPEYFDPVIITTFGRLYEMTLDDLIINAGSIKENIRLMTKLAFIPHHQYEVGDLCTVDNQDYFCIANHTSGDVINKEYWSDGVGNQWQPYTRYFVGSNVFIKYQLDGHTEYKSYTCKEEHLSQSYFDVSKFDENPNKFYYQSTTETLATENETRRKIRNLNDTIKGFYEENGVGAYLNYGNPTPLGIKATFTDEQGNPVNLESFSRYSVSRVVKKDGEITAHVNNVDGNTIQSVDIPLEKNDIVVYDNQENDGYKYFTKNEIMKEAEIQQMETILDNIDRTLSLRNDLFDSNDRCQFACQVSCQTGCQVSCQYCNTSQCHNQHCGTF